jgi:hypothetical protein
LAARVFRRLALRKRYGQMKRRNSADERDLFKDLATF